MDNSLDPVLHSVRRLSVSPKISKIEIWPKLHPKVINSQNKSHRDHIWGCLNYKSGLRISIWPLKVPFFVVRKRSVLPKVAIFETKKMVLPSSSGQIKILRTLGQNLPISSCVNSARKTTPLNHSAVLIWNLDLASTRSNVQ